MSAYQQVLDFLKARGGVANLRELKQFPNSILDTLQLHQYIKVTGRVGSYEVCLICSEFQAKDEKKPQPTQIIIKPKEPFQIPKKPKAKPQLKITDTRVDRCKQIRNFILDEIKKVDEPVSALELKDKLLIRARVISYHLNILENEHLVCSIDWNRRLWIDADRKNLLNKMTGNYVGRCKNKNAVLDVLKSTNQAMSVADILCKLPSDQCSGTTLRKILELFVTTGMIKVGHLAKSNVMYFALIENSIALSHLHQLTKYKKRKLNSQLPLPPKKQP
ncbi:MAG: hypothetical protein RLZZ184_88 [Cyanobacteriota bacterium]|jgi:DNA-binding transcriptional ArsR family regulator